jgi:hypothetical protein
MSNQYETDAEVHETLIDAFDKSTGRGDFLRIALATGAGAAAVGVGAGLLGARHANTAALGLSTKRNHLGVPQSDIDILNYALTLEHMEATFYTNVNPLDAPTRQAAAYIKIIAAHEKGHVAGLTAAIQQLGGTPVKARIYRFPRFSLPFGITMENLGVGAYLGVAPFIKTPSILLTAASIVTVEARHAAVWAALNHAVDFSGTGGAFDVGIAKDTVLKTVSPFFTHGM